MNNSKLDNGDKKFPPPCMNEYDVQLTRHFFFSGKCTSVASNVPVKPWIGPRMAKCLAYSDGPGFKAGNGCSGSTLTSTVGLVLRSSQTSLDC